MLHQVAWLAAVTVLGVLEQGKELGKVIIIPDFCGVRQVIYVRRKCKVSPPLTLGPPEFERIFRAQTNCSEYFPIFISLLWIAGVFSHQVLAAFCGFLYLYARYWYFIGYARSAQERLGPMYLSAGVLCILIVLSVVGLAVHFVSVLYF